MTVDLSCPYCAHCLMTDEPEAYLPKMGTTTTCDHCGESFNITQKHLQKHLTPERRKKAMAVKAKARALAKKEMAAQAIERQQPKPASSAPTPAKKRPPKNMNRTDYAGGLGVASLVVYFSYFLFLIALITIVMGMVSGKGMLALIGALGIIFFGMSSLLFAHTSKAIMKSADYLRVLAERCD